MPHPVKIDQPRRTLDNPGVGALLRRNRPRSKLFFARTADGWKIALHRYEPRANARTGQAPVLLCHGLGANRYNLDAPGRLSMARWLCKRGYDCWVIELRGAGRSSKPKLYNRKRFDWTFDDYVHHDIPAALARIAEISGHKQVHWVGHSMGGMVAYAYLMTHDNDVVRSLTAIASPSFAHTAHPVLDRVVHLRKLLYMLPKIPYGKPMGMLLVPFMPFFKPTFGRLFGNPKNLSTRDLQRLVVVTPTDLPPSLIIQFGDWYAGRGFTDRYRSVDFYRSMHRIDVPSLIIAGTLDSLTPPEDMRYVFDNIGAEDKRFIAFGKDSGCQEEYGHIDLVLGRHAAEEVFPHVLDWLDTH